MPPKSYDREPTVFPSVSFIIPTYNAGETIADCLTSVFNQDYPRAKIEVIIVDGGSTDKSIEIAARFSVKIMHNKKPLPFNQEGKDGGKAQGINVANGELIVLLDADNILSSNDWLLKTVQPLMADAEIVACETSRQVCKSDPAINRYCSALVTRTPRQDPFVLSYSNNCFKIEKSKEDVLVFTADCCDPPCIANGTTVRADALRHIGGYDYDWDTGNRLVKAGYNKFCKITSVGIYHRYVKNLNDLLKKGIWRIRYLLYSSPSRSAKKFFSNTVSNKNTRSIIIRDFFYGLTIIGPLFYAIRKFREDYEFAWFYHPIVYFLVPLTYTIVLITAPKRFLKFLGR